ncbi:MAG TPA: pyruvate kinase [Firmicutes bacterium]|nr:pyruvate kinase [Bacillota bacterium]
MRRTKIVCTMGPAVNSPEQVDSLIKAGMDVARLNLSHGKQEEHYLMLKMIRKAAAEAGKNVGILFDTRGPEVRTGELAVEPVVLREGEEFTLTTQPYPGDENKVSVTYPLLHEDIKTGSTVLIDDGLIILQVLRVSGQDIICRVENGGELHSYKGLNTPGTRINLPAMGEKDRADIKLALEKGVDFLAASFTRSAEDILEIRRLVESEKSQIMILAKIESREGIENYDSILEVADGIMVARGDLGVEIPPEEVPLLQKEFIRKCNRVGKPVITATQMLDSMIRNPRPTRAEASDVANAIFDGTDAVMLSGETAVGRFPLETVKTMSRIAVRAEDGIDYRKILSEQSASIEKAVTDAISYATCSIAQELGADAILTATQSGTTARMVSKYRPKAPIIAVSSRRQVAAQLTLTWGVTSVICPPAESTDDMFFNAMQCALDEELISNGDLVVITAGVPVGVPGTTNLLRVETVGEIIVKGTGVGKSAVSGEALVVTKESDLLNLREGMILVSRMTDRDYLPALEKAAALVTEEGGLTSHGAIVAINLGKPAVVGVSGAVDEIKTGETITVDAIRGLIYRGQANVL